jgi:beta-glucosidase-like glycosyl hydrolase/CubicO group peptidase (beta-lactamase class C family)
MRKMAVKNSGTIRGLLILLFIFAGCTGVKSVKPVGWVDQQLSLMSIEQKIAQMMVIDYTPKFYNQKDPHFEEWMNQIKKYQVGGLAFYRGDPYAVARTIERFQNAADIPLMVMADMEWGLSMRVNESTTFLENMAVGATGSEQYAFEMGRITAQEAKAMGIHVGFAPVMDVNNNPDNIIINTRSYGEDPQLVARLGSAFIRGFQENGILATAKHFPGHGDTDVDSHLELPSIPVSKERIENMELVPFKAAVDAGVKCVMVGHSAYGAFQQMEGRPATLDPYFIKNVLRKEMDFKGLVITDAMGMGAISNHYWSGEAAVMAINAGTDFLLFPPNFEATFDFIVQAVKDGRLSVNTLDIAVRRILRAKFEMDLYRKPKISLEYLEKVMASPEHLEKAEVIASASMTLVQDKQNIFPLEAEKLDSVMVITITDREWGYIYEGQLKQEVGKRIPYVQSALVDPRSTEKELHEIIADTDSVKAVIVGIFVRWGSYKGSVTLPDTTAQLLQELFKADIPMAVISFGSPYILRQLPDVQSYLCAYGTSPLAIDAATRAVFGEIPLSAKLPVSIPEFYSMGDGIEKPARKMELVRQNNDDFLTEAYLVLENAIADSVFPGAQVAIVRNDTLIASRGFGRQTYNPESPEVTIETIYDIASVTKVVATTVVAMQLFEQNKIKLDIPVKSYLPQFHGGMKDSVTMRHLLTHSSGLHWWVDLWNKAKTNEEALIYIYQLPLDYAPGDSMIYSDLGIIMVGEIMETVTGKSIDELASEMIYKPMGMTNTMYNPQKNLLPRIAPTEFGGSMNRGQIHGEVHDENTFFLGGVSTHAGIFTTAEDLALFAQMLINGGIYKLKRFLRPETIKYWTTRQDIPPGSDRALGWDTPSDKGSSAGDYFSAESFGHLGFTGTSLWIDPNRKIAIILLTNRVYPTREREGIYKVRRDFHNAAMKALLEEMGEEIHKEVMEVYH